MPELPEVETIVRGMSKHLIGFTIKSINLQRKDLRFPIPNSLKNSLSGRKIIEIQRRGKYIIIYNNFNKLVLLHLGMSGRIKIRPKGSPLEKHDHIIIQLNSGKEIVYNDPRRFGMIDCIDKSELSSHRWIKSLGPEPLSRSFNTNYAMNFFSSKSAPVKNILMDQKFVAGVGNIYACEALFFLGFLLLDLEIQLIIKNQKI